jgi:ribokinase
MTRILVIGDLNLDIQVCLLEPIPPGGEIQAPILLEPGGAGGTFARTASGLGATVLFLGAVGEDPAGDFLEQTLFRAGVHAKLRRISSPTGAVLAMESADDRSMVCSRGANDGLTGAWIAAAWPSGCDHLHVSGYALLSETQRPGALHAFSLAERQGMSRSVDPPPASLLEAFGEDRYRALIPSGAWVFPNVSEGMLLSSQTEASRIAETLSRSFPVGAITLGDRGALAWDGREQDLCRVAAVAGVNPTGAGDVYAAAFVTARLGGAALASCNRSACDAATAMLRARGSRQGLHPMLGRPMLKDDSG